LSAGGRSLAGLVFRIFLFVLVLVAIVVVIIAALARKPDSANELNLNPPRERGPILSEQGVSIQQGEGGRRARASTTGRKADSNPPNGPPHDVSTEDDPREKGSQDADKEGRASYGARLAANRLPGCGTRRSSRGAERLSGERQGRSRSPR
jgi:hypothetical protein